MDFSVSVSEADSGCCLREGQRLLVSFLLRLFLYRCQIFLVDSGDAYLGSLERDGSEIRALSTDRSTGSSLSYLRLRLPFRSIFLIVLIPFPHVEDQPSYRQTGHSQLDQLRIHFP